MMPGEFFAALEAEARERSTQPAFTFQTADRQSSTYTFGDLFTESRRIAERLRAYGLDDQGRPLGILLGTQEEQVLHYLGALCAGAIPAILTPPNRKLNHEYYAVTMGEVLRRSDFGALITDLEDVRFSGRMFRPRTIEPFGELTDQPADGVGPTEPLGASFLQFSSGTTGIKRGVLVRDSAVLAQLRSYAGTLGLTDRDVIVSWLPLYHDMGFIACLNMPLLFGVHTVMIDPISWVSRPALLLEAVTRWGGSLSWNPNFAYAFMAQRVRDRDLVDLELSTLRGLVNCSEPVTYSSQRQFTERFTPRGLRPDVFLGCYAMAETTFALTHGSASDETSVDPIGPEGIARPKGADPYVSVGRALPGVDLEVRNLSGGSCADREVGELWVRSPFNAIGYHREPRATAEAFVGEWYRTGDLGYRVGDAMFVTGRRKDVIIVGGVNVFPSDLEDVVGGVAGLIPGRVAAFARFDRTLETEKVIVLAESELEGSSARDTVLEARRWLQASFELASFEVHLVPPGWLVKSSSGKMARSENRAKWVSERCSGEESD